MARGKLVIFSSNCHRQGYELKAKGSYNANFEINEMQDQVKRNQNSNRFMFSHASFKIFNNTILLKLLP